MGFTLRRIAYGRRRGFVVRSRVGECYVRSVVEDKEVRIADDVSYVEIEAFLEAPRDCSYAFEIESASTPILYVEGRALEVLGDGSGRYVSRAIRLARGAYYRLRIEIPQPVPGSSVRIWVSHGDLAEPAHIRCFAPLSPYITIASLPQECEVALVNVGIVARARAVGGVAQLDVSKLKHPISARLAINGVEVAELIDAWGGDVYVVTRG